MLETALTLPKEMNLEIFNFLSPKELGRCCQVCKVWQEAASSNCLWKALYPQIMHNGISLKEHLDINAISSIGTLIKRIEKFVDQINFNEWGKFECLLPSNQGGIFVTLGYCIDENLGSFIENRIFTKSFESNDRKSANSAKLYTFTLPYEIKAFNLEKPRRVFTGVDINTPDSYYDNRNLSDKIVKILDHRISQIKEKDERDAEYFYYTAQKLNMDHLENP